MDAGPAAQGVNIPRRSTLAREDGLTLWDTETEMPIARFELDDDLRPIGSQPGTGQVVVHNGRSGQVEYWDFSAVPPGNGFQVACAYLPDTSLRDIVEGSPMNVNFEICGPDYDPPMPDVAE